MKTIFFDFDYTLADSSEAIVKCFHHAFNTANLPIPPKRKILKTIGMPLIDSFRLLAPKGNPEELVSLFRLHADQIMVAQTQLYPMVPSVIMALKDAGYKLGIVSTKYRFRIEAILEREKIRSFFEVIIGGEDVTEPKPDPEGLLLAISKTNSPKEQIIYVGDSVIDGQTASAAGVAFIGVTSGATPKSNLKKAGATIVLSNLGQLNHYLSNEPMKNIKKFFPISTQLL